MARRRHHRRHRRHSRSSRSLVPGISNTTLALGAVGAYFLMPQLFGGIGTSPLQPGITTGVAGLGAWGRPTVPAGLGFFQGFRGGLGAFHQGLYPARRWWT